MRSIRTVVAPALAFALATGLAGADLVGPDGNPDPSYPGFHAWFDAGEGVNGSGTPPDGASVTSWMDLTGRGHDLVRTSGSSGERPTFIEGAVNGLGALRFDGNDYIWADRSGEFGTIASPGRTYFVVARVRSLTDGYVLDSSSSVGRNALLAGQSADSTSWWIYTGAGDATHSAPISLDTWQVHTVIMDGPAAAQVHRIDGLPVAGGTQPLADMAGLILGARYTTGNGLDGDVAEVLVYDEALGDADAQAIEAYLSDKYLGVSPRILDGDGVPNAGFPAFYAWFDAAVGVNGPGTPADGAPVTSWDDRTGRGHDLTRTDADDARRPVFRDAIANDLPAIQFDGDDHIWGDGSGGFGTLAGAKTVFFVSRVRRPNTYIFDASSSAGRNAVLTGQSSSPGRWNIYTGFDPVTAGPLVTMDVFQVHSVLIADGYSEHFINGESVATGDAPMAPLNGLILGSRYSLAQYLDGDIAEVLFYEEVLSGSDRRAVEGYLLAKHPITQPPYDPPEFVDVFSAGQDGYPNFRIPAILTTTEGTLLAFAEARQGGDHSRNDIVMKRSTDGGLSWGPLVLMHDAGGDSLNDPLVVQVLAGPNTGRIILMYMRFPEGCHTNCVDVGYGDNSSHNYMMQSDDDGVTWTGPVDVTEQVRRPTSNFAGTPGVGIQKRRAPHAGRLIMPLRQGPTGHIQMYALYSDDGGETWAWGDLVDDSQVSGGGDEVQMVELDDGTLILNAREHGSSTPARKIAFSPDGGETWTPLADDDELMVTPCMSSLLRYTDPLDSDTSRILFASPGSSSSRVNGTIRISYDNCETWTVAKTLYPGGYAYSCLTILPDGSIACFFERDGYQHMTLGIFSLEWLTNGEDSLCPPDYTRDGVVNSQDFVAFLNDFVAGDLNADYNHDGALNSQDFVAFFNDFVAGC
jgi:sialidase-1